MIAVILPAAVIHRSSLDCDIKMSNNNENVDKITDHSLKLLHFKFTDPLRKADLDQLI